MCLREWLSGGAPPCQGGGRGFDPRLALLIKMLTFYLYYDIIICVVVTFLLQSYIICASGSVVEHLLAKEGVAGSIPVSRSLESTILVGSFFIILGNFGELLGKSFIYAVSARFRYHFPSNAWYIFSLVSSSVNGLYMYDNVVCILLCPSSSLI